MPHSKLRRLWSLYRAIGPPLLPCLADRLLHRPRLRRVRLRGLEVYLRTASPDLFVAESSLIDLEYAHVRCPAPRVIIDAGANIGTSALYFAWAYPAARILAIEPETSNFELLCRNAAPFPNIVPIQAALWSSPGPRAILDRGSGPWGYTVSETDNRTAPTGQRVACVTMADLLAEHGIERVDLLKMDIEGGEKDVLEHAEGWIDRIGVLTVELHERICPGCEAAFARATAGFARIERHGEKYTAYREG